MKMFIPPLGYELILTENWHFKLFFEYRNEKLLELNNWKAESYFIWKNLETDEEKNFHYRNENTIPEEYRFINCILPEHTILKVDRIYIRKGAKDFDSVSFFADIPGQKKRVRFWAKLDEVNNIEFSELSFRKYIVYRLNTFQFFKWKEEDAE